MARFTQNAGGTGTQLNYVQVAGGQATVTSAPSSIIDLDITTTGKPVQISVTGEGSNASAGSWVRINLFRDGSAIGNEMQLEASATSENVPYAINFIDNVAAGTYNYSIRATEKSSGNWQFGEVAGPIMNAVELTGFKGDDGADGTDGAANLVVPTAIKDQNDADFITFERTGTGTARIATPQDDLSLRSARDITLYAGDDGPGNVYIGWGDAVYTPDSTNRVATIADIQSAGTGGITFVDNTISTDNGDDIVIQNKDNSDIVKARIVLDQSNEQVLLEAINSSSNTFTTGDWTTATWSQNVIQINGTENGVIPFFNGLNGNVTHIQVNNGEIVRYDGASYGPTDLTMYTITNAPVESDPVTIESLRLIYGVTSKIDINYDNEEFLLQSNGMNLNLSSDQEINLDSSDDIDLSAANRVRIYGDTNVFINSNGGGEYIGTSIDDDFGNQIATINNINAAIETGTPEVSFEVNGGTTATQPTFDGAPLFSGTYVKIGPQVHFQIQVDMDNITSFGTGQYYVDLPFDAKYGYQFKEGCLHHIATSNQYAIGGHVAAGTNRLFLTYTGSNGQDEMFDYNSPVTLAVADNFHIAGTYITN